MRGRAGDKTLLLAEGTRFFRETAEKGPATPGMLREAVDSTRREGIASSRSLSVGIPTHRRR